MAEIRIRLLFNGNLVGNYYYFYKILVEYLLAADKSNVS